MKAITIWQPYASLVVSTDQQGRPLKMVETRSWKTSYRGPLAIHAAKTRMDTFFLGMPHREHDFFTRAELFGDEDLKKLPYGAVVGIVTLCDCIPMEGLFHQRYDTPQERSFGDWSPGRYGWILANPVKFDEPIPAVGKQGLWEWDDCGAIEQSWRRQPDTESEYIGERIINTTFDGPDPCVFRTHKVYRNATVKVLVCKECGYMSWDWETQPDTEEIDPDDFEE